MIDHLRNLIAAAGRLPVVSLLLVLLAVPATFVEPLADVAQFSRPEVAAGQVWRLLTCHLAHWSLDHFLWDAVALLVLGLLCEPLRHQRFAGCVLISALAIPLATAMLKPDIHTYRGLSGIDSAVFTLLAVSILRDAVSRRQWPLLLGTLTVLLGFCGKISFELATGTTLFVDSHAADMIPLPLSHLVGALVGCPFGCIRSTRHTPCAVSSPAPRIPNPARLNLLPLGEVAAGR